MTEITILRRHLNKHSKTPIIQHDKQKGLVLRIYQRLFRNQQQLTSISLKDEFSQTADYYCYINEKC